MKMHAALMYATDVSPEFLRALEQLHFAEQQFAGVNEQAWLPRMRAES
ncbi:hypothetical protein [Pseudomonas sp. NPDC087626]